MLELILSLITEILLIFNNYFLGKNQNNLPIKMERESVEEFLTPITPSKGRNKQQSEHEQPESPSKAQARSRLGSLLGQIRKGEGRHPNDEDEQQQQSRAEIMYLFFNF